MTDATHVSLDPEMGKKIYVGLYDTLSRGIGENVILNNTNLRRDSYDSSKPMESLTNLFNGLNKMFGKETIKNMVTMTVWNEFGVDRGMEIMKELTPLIDT